MIPRRWAGIVAVLVVLAAVGPAVGSASTTHSASGVAAASTSVARRADSRGI